MTSTPQENATVRGYLDNPLVHLLILALVAFAAYANSFGGQFVYDDIHSIAENQAIRSLAGFLQKVDFIHSNRYVGDLTFALNYHFGELQVFGYHAVNLAIHLLNAWLVYALVALSFRTPLLESSRLATRRGWVALAAALLFVAHPLQIQAVTYIVQRYASLTALLYLAALYGYLRWRLAWQKGRPLSAAALAGYLFALASAALAMKTKENAITLPFVLVLYEVSFFGKPAFKRLTALVPILTTGAIIPLSMVNLAKPVGQVLGEVSRVTAVQATLSRWEYLCTQFSVIVTYLRLLVLPVGQNFDYDYPVNHSLTEPRAFLSLALLLALFGGALVLYRRACRGGDPALRLAGFGMLWFFVTLSVESSVIPIADVIFEHRVYLPSVGFFAALVTLVALGVESRTVRNPQARRWAAGVLAAVVVALTTATLARNTVWQDEETLWSDDVAKAPRNERALYNLATTLADKGRPAEALPYLQRAIEVKPDYVDAYNNLGKVYDELGQKELSVAMYQRALSFKPDHPESLYNLGRALLVSGGDPARAIELLQQAIGKKPDYPDAYVNLAAAYNKARQFDKTVSLLSRLGGELANRPDALLNLGVAYVGLGNIAAAQEELAALRLSDPAMAQQLMNFMAAAGRR